MFVARIPELRARRQLEAIEASIVPHMKSEDARRVMERHRRDLTAPEDRPKPKTLLEGFQQAGWAIEEVPAKPS